MTGFLASVMNLQEAQIVLRAEADIIDLKNPNQGALGAVSNETIREIVQSLPADTIISATVGDLPADPDQILDQTYAKAKCGVDYVKVGMFSKQHISICLPALQTAAEDGIAVIAVLFADQQFDLQSTLESCAQFGLKGVMLDTADKSSGGLLQHQTAKELAAFIRLAKSLQLLTGLAGSLRIKDVATLLPLMPDYIGFRTALCSQNMRTNVVDQQAAIHVRQALSRPDDRQIKIA